jgi:prevent-host-death family protein
MKKIKKYTTTEFYNNPSKVLNYVRDGGTAFLGYKRVKEPLAVLISYKDYKQKKETVDKSKSLWERYGHKAIHAPEYKDSAKYIREQRDQE